MDKLLLRFKKISTPFLEDRASKKKSFANIVLFLCTNNFVVLYLPDSMSLISIVVLFEVKYKQ